MKYKSVFGYFVIGIFLFFASGCNEDKVDDSGKLLGRWDIIEASRGGQATESLDQLFFEFFQDGKMRTNILGATEDAVYSMENMIIKQRESQLEIDYTVDSLTDSVLTMYTTINRFNFRFRLGKTIEEE